MKEPDRTIGPAGDSLNDLPNDQRAALLQKFQTAFDALQSTEMVLPGEQYLSTSNSQSISPVTAKQLLYATLHFHLDTDHNSPRGCGLLRRFADSTK